MAHKLLLVEDDEVILGMYRKLFQNHGYEVITAMDGEDGLNKALQEHPDLTLLDIKMPKMDGMTMLREMRQDNWGKGAKVIILTNLSPTDRIVDEVMVNEPSYYVVKSNTKPEMVLDKVKDVLGDDTEGGHSVG